MADTIDVRWLPRAPDGERYGYHTCLREWVIETGAFVVRLSDCVPDRLAVVKFAPRTHVPSELVSEES